MRRGSGNGGEFSRDALDDYSDEPDFKVDPEAYVNHIAKAKEAVRIPIIGSLNGSTFGGWQRYARLIEQAGADALELNIYNVPTDPERTADDIETEYLTIVTSIKGLLKIPVAVKLSPYFTNLSRFARRLDAQGANALVLFNRFYQPDIELETLEVSPNVLLSTPMAMRLPMRWIALLYGRIGANLAATSGIHHGVDALKMIMAGADVTMLCSVLLRHGIDHIRVTRTRNARMAGGTRIRIGRANQRHHEPEKLPGPNCIRARAIHSCAEELSEESVLDRGVVMRYIAG